MKKNKIRKKKKKYSPSQKFPKEWAKQTKYEVNQHKTIDILANQCFPAL